MYREINVLVRDDTGVHKKISFFIGDEFDWQHRHELCSDGRWTWYEAIIHKATTRLEKGSGYYELAPLGGLYFELKRTNKYAWESAKDPKETVRVYAGRAVMD